MLIIKEFFNKIKTNLKKVLEDKTIFVAMIIILVALSSFGLGRLSKIEEGKTPLLIQDPTQSANNNQTVNLLNTAGESSSEEIQPLQEVSLKGKYVASKNSNKYHAPWCAGAKSIKLENQIWFESKEEAEAAGYTPASNCKGI